MSAEHPSSAPSSRPANKLLRRLRDDEFERLRPLLTTIPVHARQVFHRRNEPIEHVYFPNGGVASLTISAGNGPAVEVATVGVEGVLGLSASFGPGSEPAETMMQVPDTSAERLSAADFRAELKRGGTLQHVSIATPRRISA